MPDLLLHFITVALWLALTATAWRAARPAVAGGPQPRADVRMDALIAPVALVLHGILLYRSVIVPEGLDLGVANAISMLVWLTVLIYWLAGLVYSGIAGMLGLMAPVAATAVILQLALARSGHIVCTS
jgi:ABC-type uncharacterized transport system permease subunit